MGGRVSTTILTHAVRKARAQFMKNQDKCLAENRTEVTNSSGDAKYASFEAVSETTDNQHLERNDHYPPHNE